MDCTNMLDMINDTVKHKELVLENCRILSNWLASMGESNLALELIKRGISHDNSKFTDTEFNSLGELMKLKHLEGFLNSHYILNDCEKRCIEAHWKNNRHHPEHFKNCNDMSKLDILEMVCDWYARSLQYNTDFIPFVKERQRNRFHFSDEKFDLIIKYCKLIEELYLTQQSY